MYNYHANNSKLLTVKEVAEILRVCKKTVLTKTRKGDLVGVYINQRCLRYLEEDVNDYVNRHRKDNL